MGSTNFIRTQKDGHLPFCVDYLKLNTNTTQDPFPKERMDKALTF